MDPDSSPEFWDFSFEEFGVYDIPSTIKHILKSTGEDKITLVGYS